MSNKKFIGAWCPSVTPFTEDGKIDYIAIEKHYDRLTQSGINGILLMGSIGEFATLSIDERIDLISKVKKFTSLPMIAHTSATYVPEIVKMSNAAKDAVFDAVMILPHYYYGQTSKQIIEYYLDIDSRIDIPWFIYNFPARTGCDVNADIVVELLQQCPKFIGIKDTVDTLSHTRDIVFKAQKIRPDFSVLAGYDEYFVPNLINGGTGVLSGLNNLVPELFAKIMKAYAENDLQTIATTHKKISELMSIYAIGQDFVTTIKTAVERKFGYMNGTSRNYGGQLNDTELKKLDELFK